MHSLKFSGRAHCQGTEHTGGNPSPAQIAVPQGFGVCPSVPQQELSQGQMGAGQRASTGGCAAAVLLQQLLPAPDQLQDEKSVTKQIKTSPSRHEPCSSLSGGVLADTSCVTGCVTPVRGLHCCRISSPLGTALAEAPTGGALLQFHVLSLALAGWVLVFAPTVCMRLRAAVFPRYWCLPAGNTPRVAPARWARGGLVWVPACAPLLLRPRSAECHRQQVRQAAPGAAGVRAHRQDPFNSLDARGDGRHAEALLLRSLQGAAAGEKQEGEILGWKWGCFCPALSSSSLLLPLSFSSTS